MSVGEHIFHANCEGQREKVKIMESRWRPIPVSAGEISEETHDAPGQPAAAAAESEDEDADL